jgi:octanoyl-[GcvH]:protein N-octanoyltransferase
VRESALRTIRVLRRGYASVEALALDTALSRALLEGTSAGTEPETLRLYRAQPEVAFGPADTSAPGYARAVQAARALGFAPIERLAGGRAAVFHEGTLAFAWAVPAATPRLGIRARFEELAALVHSTLSTLGIDARVGEVPGEYCPGPYSVSVRGERKLMGVGQRLLAHAAHVGGVIVVHDAARVREALLPVYEALGVTWRPAATGAVEEEAPGVTVEAVADALLVAFAERYELLPGAPSAAALARARALEPAHRAGVARAAGRDPAATAVAKAAEGFAPG